MTIVYTDGGKLNCSNIIIEGGCLYADGLYEIPIEEVEVIKEE